MANTKVQSEQIEDGSITADKIADGAIVATELADNAVTTAKINADAVTGAKIADDAINSEHYTDGSIDTAHIADDQVTQAKMANDSVGADELASNAVVTASIVDANVTTAKIADGNISTAKIADNAVTSAKVDTNIDIAGTFDVTGATTLDSTLNVAGIVGIGNTNASSFNSNSNNLVVGSGSGGEGITIYSANDNNAQIFFADGTTGDAAYRGVLRYAHDVDRFEFFTAGTIRAVLDTSGNIQIVGGNQMTQGLFFYNGASGHLLSGIRNKSNSSYNDSGGLEFLTSGTSNAAESVKMSIDTQGNVGIGTTSPAHMLDVANTQANYSSARFVSTSAAATEYGISLQLTNSPNDATRYFLACTDSSSTRAIIRSNGGFESATNSYGGISDVKVKENIVDATDKLESLKQVKIRNYNLIGDSKKQIGVIAQELETIFPSMVEENIDLDDDNNELETTTKSVKYSVFVPIIIKAMQEQQTIIEDLKARIEALES